MISGMDAWKNVPEPKEEFVSTEEWDEETVELIEGNENWVAYSQTT